MRLDFWCDEAEYTQRGIRSICAGRRGLSNGCRNAGYHQTSSRDPVQPRDGRVDSEVAPDGDLDRTLGRGKDGAKGWDTGGRKTIRNSKVPSSEMRGCPHNLGREVYCIQGFWGFRHRIEQITPAGKAANTSSQISMSTAAHSVCLASSVNHPWCTALSSELQKSFGPQFVQFPPLPPPDVPFGTFMWSEQTRPAVLVLLSHMMNPATGSAQILLAPATSADALTLTADQVSEFTRAKNVRKGTNSLVLLMACESTETTVSTLNDFTPAFRAAGASAIIGTEVPVYSSLATRFAKDLIKTLRTKRADGEWMQLGESVPSVVNQLLNEGNPMGLLFNYCGNANLFLT
jgi:hypothetical protein